MDNYLITKLDESELRNIIKECLREELENAKMPQASSKEDIMNVKECAELLNLAVPTIYGMVHRRRIPFIKKIGFKRLYFSRETVEDWLFSKTTYPID